MFNVGGGEFLVIAVIALIVLGPNRLPHAARQVGKAMSELRRLSTGFQNEIKGAFDEAEQDTVPRSTSPARDVLGAGSPADVDPGPNAPPTRPPARPRRRTPLRAEPDPSAETRPTSE